MNTASLSHVTEPLEGSGGEEENYTQNTRDWAVCELGQWGTEEPGR